MRKFAILLLALGFAMPAAAQPIIIELDPDKKDEKPKAAPSPVAPPQAKPSEGREQASKQDDGENGKAQQSKESQ